MKIKFILLVLISFSLLSIVNAELSSVSYCCDETINGQFCASVEDISQCKSDGTNAQTSCEATSYCQTGTCYDSDTGICRDNVPRYLCESNGGSWDSRSSLEVEQCQKGCCLLSDTEGFFTTLVSCKNKASDYGLKLNFKKSIISEQGCYDELKNQDLGACVYESDFVKVCEFTTRHECGAEHEFDVILENSDTEVGGRAFYKDYLCSAEQLSTSCVKQSYTNCFDQDVYWYDSCDNKENVYAGDSQEQLDKSWNNGKIKDANEICSPSLNDNCGNCDMYSVGTSCVKPNEGENAYCQDKNCVDSEGNSRKNGESWCVYEGLIRKGTYPVGNGLDTVGSRHYREICQNGEVILEPCEDLRQQYCLDAIREDETTGQEYSFAGCFDNNWPNCINYDNQEDCENIENGNCKWLENEISLLFNTNSQISKIRPDFNETKGICVQNYPIGTKFWEESGEDQCSIGTVTCTITWEKKLIDSKKNFKIVENIECTQDEWANQANQVCISLGDCGGNINYQDVLSNEGYEWNYIDQTIDEDEKEEVRTEKIEIEESTLNNYLKELIGEKLK